MKELSGITNLIDSQAEELKVSSSFPFLSQPTLEIKHNQEFDMTTIQRTETQGSTNLNTWMMRIFSNKITKAVTMGHC